MTERKKGKYTLETEVVQVKVPKDIFDIVREKAEREGFSMTTFWRRWVIDGFKAAQERGEM
jgi:hypothetical protein